MKDTMKQNSDFKSHFYAITIFPKWFSLGRIVMNQTFATSKMKGSDATTLLGNVFIKNK